MIQSVDVHLSCYASQVAEIKVLLNGERWMLALGKFLETKTWVIATVRRSTGSYCLLARQLPAGAN
uniref:Uncharacterized protein n=1 Tax=Aegilops tauschii subsp. strangulata TaxID=200361 RepID=A0A452Z0F4_AEGTS